MGKKHCFFFIKALFILGLAVLVIHPGCRVPIKETISVQSMDWRALHLLGYTTDEMLNQLQQEIPGLHQMGINVLILEVDYSFEYMSHPELRQDEMQITKKGARKFADKCREENIRLIIEFQCLGHQSWEEKTYPLLIQYPHFDLTPGAFPNNDGIYCREWDPLNPEVNTIIFSLMDELIDAFQVDAVHVGMDEVFLLGSDLSPSTYGKDPAKLYAKAVNDIYDHLVKKRGVEMLMWGDRLIDGNKYKYGEWEASLNGTYPAVDLIPRDIIICDWHYEPRKDYPSVKMFIDKGFRVLPTSWKNVNASLAFIKYSQRLNDPNVMGHLFTIWSKPENLLEYPPMVEALKRQQ